MITVNSADEIRVWKKDGDWYVAPTNEHIMLGAGARIGAGASIGGWARIGESARIGKRASIGESASIGGWASIGESASIGERASIGESASIGGWASIGKRASIGAGARIGEGASIGDEITSEQINKDFIAALPTKFIAWKWVDKNRMNLTCHFEKIKYTKGKTITAQGKISDQQCGAGLHVLRPGYTLGMAGLSDFERPDNKCLRVLVYRKDVLFAGLPGWDFKLRVKKLKVLD